MPKRKVDETYYLVYIFVFLVSLFGLYLSFNSYETIEKAFPGNIYAILLYYFFVAGFIIFAIMGILGIYGTYITLKEQKTLKDFKAKTQKPVS